ncbi:hypothetical protein [Cellulomonas sp. NPDC058312]|uniref:hypothetical protein n=1 Tax=Cellulomonas sp. NPDC058312 TaxID=3346441 RepID=UPI0036EC9947
MQTQSTTPATTTATTCPAEDRRRRRRAALAWGSLAGVAALVTTAAFTDVARLNVGAQGLGGAASSYNIQVGATDAAGALVPGEWQEADDLAGVPLAFVNADRLAPGDPGAGTEIPVRNDSPTFASTISVSVDALADDAGAGRVTDPDYLASLRFSVAMGATTADPNIRDLQDLTFDQVQSLQMNGLAPGEESVIAINVRLLPQSQSGASYDDNSLNGKGAHLQLRIDGASR